MELIEKLENRTVRIGKYWIYFGLFLCSYCNKEVIKRLSNGKAAKSCGCVRSKLAGEGRKTHGECDRNNLYIRWKHIKSRCFNFNAKDFDNYGGRGITVCQEWLEYIPFRDWALSNGYKKELTIDRIDNDGNYEPKNCRWVTNTINIRNSRATKLNPKLVIEIRGKFNEGIYSKKQLAKEYHVSDIQIGNIVHFKHWRDIHDLSI